MALFETGILRRLAIADLVMPFLSAIGGLRLAGEVVKAAAGRRVIGAAAGQPLPTADDRVDIYRVELDLDKIGQRAG